MCGEKLCEGAGCANKRRIYKLGMGGLRKLGCVERNYAKAPVAQIRG